MTRSAVLEVFAEFSESFEGRLAFMYLDVLGLVTTGVGNLIDPVELALPLDWQKPDGSCATAAEIRTCWNIVKARQDLRLRGGVIFGKLAGNTLRLTEQTISDLVLRKLAENEVDLRHRFPAFDTWPADAQLGLHSMAWAAGPGFHFPRFAAACNADPPDFVTAARESHISNAALLRNDADYQLFMNAARVVADGLDPDTLVYPNGVQPEDGVA